MSHRPRLCASLLLAFATAIPAATANAPSKLSSPEDIEKEFATVPCEDKDRLAAVKALFEKAGAPADAIRIDTYDDVENLVVVKPGESAEKIVIGAHYDKTADGCGAIDNWTGQVALAHLYRMLRDIPLQKTLVFVAFGREEKGLIGSRAMTRNIDGDAVAGYCAMINIDSLGLGPPQVADNMSSKKLARRYNAPPETAPMKLPINERAISALNNTGTCPVGNCRGCKRANTRCAALRPMASGASKSCCASATLNQPSRCIASPSPAIRAQPVL